MVTIRPHDLPAPQEEDTGHLKRIANHLADSIPFADGVPRANPEPDVEKQIPADTAQSKCTIDPCVWIAEVRNISQTETLQERLPLLVVSHMHERQLRPARGQRLT